MRREMINILAEIAELEESEIRENDNLDELGIDSLMFIDFCIRVEKKWNIKLEVNELVKIKNVEILLQYIEKQKEKSQEVSIEILH